MTHPALPQELQGLVGQKADGEGRKAKLSLVVNQSLDEALSSKLKEVYGQNDKLNKAIDKALKSMKATDVPQDDDESDDANGG
jgi:hypothetical protein